MLTRGHQLLRNMFGLDYRSLAFLRMALAALNLANLYVSLPWLRTFYTDDGVLPRATLLNFAYFPPTFSLYMADGSMSFAGALFALQAACALAMLVGYRTQLATVASYVLLFSQQGRNPYVLIGADQVLRLMSFWAMFLPLGRRWSLDVALGRVPPAAERDYVGWPGFAYTAQFVIIYYMSAVMKTGASWHVDYTAVYDALSLGVYGRPLGTWLNQFDGLTQALTRWTLYVEIYGPLLFILPMWNNWGRLLGLALLIGLQVGFNLTMNLGMFGLVMVGMLVCYVPDEFWRYVAEPMGQWLARRGRTLASSAAGKEFWQKRWRRWQAREQQASLHPGLVGGFIKRHARGLGWVRDGAVLALLAYVILWNHDVAPNREPLLPNEVKWVGWATGLDQQFDLFSPDPMLDDGWYVMQGWLWKGQPVNVFTGEREVTFARPAWIADTYPGQRWRRYLIYLWDPAYQPLMEPLAQYLTKNWNRRHGADEQLRYVEIYYMREIVGLHHTRSPTETRLLWTQVYDPALYPKVNPAAQPAGQTTLPP